MVYMIEIKNHEIHKDGFVYFAYFVLKDFRLQREVPVSPKSWRSALCTW